MTTRSPQAPMMPNLPVNAIPRVSRNSSLLFDKEVIYSTIPMEDLTKGVTNPSNRGSSGQHQHPRLAVPNYQAPPPPVPVTSRPPVASPRQNGQTAPNTAPAVNPFSAPGGIQGFSTNIRSFGSPMTRSLLRQRAINNENIERSIMNLDHMINECETLKTKIIRENFYCPVCGFAKLQQKMPLARATYGQTSNCLF